jgi:hypothetical protein
VVRKRHRDDQVRLFPTIRASHGPSGAIFEAPAFVAGFDDIAVVREAIEQGRGHLGIAEDARPFAEGEIVVTRIEVRS